MQAVTPLKYFGQREALLNDIFPLLPEKKFDCFYDLFSGSGSISFKAMQKNLANKYVINDSLPCLQKLWEEIKLNPQQLKNEYEVFLKNCFFGDGQPELYYAQLVEEFNMMSVDAQSASLFAFLINHAKNNIPLFDQEKKLACSIESDLVESVNSDWFAHQVDHLHHLFSQHQTNFFSGNFYEHLDLINVNDIVIFDPPYPKQSEEIYFNLKTSAELKQQIERAILILNEKNIPFILFYGVNALEPQYLFSDTRLQLVHLLHQSEHPLFGKFLEHIYFSNTFADILQSKELTNFMPYQPALVS